VHRDDAARRRQHSRRLGRGSSRRALLSGPGVACGGRRPGRARPVVGVAARARIALVMGARPEQGSAAGENWGRSCRG
jgi:hypothetical protein